MDKLYKKDEVSFVILMILMYVFGILIAEKLSELIKIQKFFTAIFHTTFSAFILNWIMKNNLTKKYGLFKPEYKLSKAWFFISLIIVATFGLLFRPKLNYSIPTTILFVISMCFVGFLEEIIFRGFLFEGMKKVM